MNTRKGSSWCSLCACLHRRLPPSAPGRKGTWRDVQVKRPKVVFGVAPNSPTTGAPRTSPPAPQEVRTYVIETETMRFELRENTTVDAPRIDVLVGEPVEFAVEKKNLWMKDQDGHEHKLSLVKQGKK